MNVAQTNAQGGGSRAPTTMLLGKRRKQNLWLRYGCISSLGLFMLLCLLCSGMLGFFYFLSHPGMFLLANILAFATAIPYCLMLLWLDRNEAEPLYLVGTALLWGAVVSTVVSMMFNDSFAALAENLVGDFFVAQALTASISAPFIEELSKGIAVGLIFTLFRDEFDNVLDGILYGALVGLGFATVENVIYYFNQGMLEGYAGMLKLTWARGLLGGLASHASYTALTGLGFGLVRVLRKGFARWLLVPVFWGLAMFAHFTWNTFCGLFIFSDDELVTYTVSLPIAIIMLEMPFVLLLLLVVGFVWRSENRIILQYLASESDDVVTDELRRGMVPARRRVLSGFLRVFRQGPVRWWHHRCLDRDLIELSFAKWHLDKDPDPTWTPDEDAEVQRLRKAIRDRRAVSGLS